jgi:hypothetical protein
VNYKGNDRDPSIRTAHAAHSPFVPMATHGKRRTNADKRRAVQRLLGNAEWNRWSDAEIAKRCAASDMLVGRIRDELSSNDVTIAHPTEWLVERNGRVYPMRPSLTHAGAPLRHRRLVRRPAHLLQIVYRRFTLDHTAATPR